MKMVTKENASIYKKNKTIAFSTIKYSAIIQKIIARYKLFIHLVSKY